MNPIRQFFTRKKTEKKFKEAGPGHKLTETSKGSESCKPSTSHVVTTQPTRHLSESAQMAGAAALARIEKKQQPPVNWSVQATRAKARKELELENSLKLKHIPKEVIQESAPVLAVSGVYFTCPLIGPEILPKAEIKEKIKEFLYNQLEQERGLTACLILHTCNSNKEKLRIGIETLSRYLTNILDNPTEEKYRKIRFNNKVFKERIIGLEGAFEFLTAAGFVQETIQQGEESEQYFIFPEENLNNLENLQMLKEALLTAEPIIPILDRNLRILKISQNSEKINLPEEFFKLSVEEIKREQEAKTEAAELVKQLRTKAMRERDELREIHMYKYTLIRIRFPDEIILQGTFYVYEKLSAVKEFIIQNLSEPEREFTLLAPGGFKLTEDDHSLLDLKLVPASILNFNWASDGLNHTEFLKPEMLLLLEQL